MRKKAPSVALLWLYQGNDAAGRRGEIEKLEYAHFEIVEVGGAGQWAKAIETIPEGTDVCIFWVDDGKPVGRDFIHQMTSPLIAGRDLRAVMHFWSGNAISVPRSMVEGMAMEDGAHSLLRLLLPTLDIAPKQPNGRLHIAFSSTERLAPLSMEPVGFPS